MRGEAAPVKDSITRDEVREAMSKAVEEGRIEELTDAFFQFTEIIDRLTYAVDRFNDAVSEALE